MRMWWAEEVGRLWVRRPGVNALWTVVDLGVRLVAVEGWRVLAHEGLLGERTVSRPLLCFYSPPDHRGTGENKFMAVPFGIAEPES